MEIRLKFGQRELDLELSSRAEFTLLRTPEVHLTTTEAEVIEQALESPVASHSFEEFFLPKDRVAVIVPDKTRKCKVHTVLPFLLERLERIGLSAQNFVLLFANGTHAHQSEAEKISILGAKIYRKYSNQENDAHDAPTFRKLGCTSRGTPVSIHQSVASADKVLVVSEVLHHYFAGFGGGAKMVMPGAASYDSIVHNHRLTLTEDGDFHPLCYDGNLEGNPVYEDIVDASQFYPPTFYVGVVLNEDGNIFHAIAGDVVEAHRKESLFADRYYSVPFSELADLVIVSAGGAPRDVNFVQAHKSIHHAHYAVKEGGVILCVAECSEGVGSETLLDWFKYSDRKEMGEALSSRYTLHGHTALSLRKKLDSSHIVLYSSLPSRPVSAMGMLPASTPAEAIRTSESFLPSRYTCLIIENGGTCLPRREQFSSSQSPRTVEL